MRFAGIEPFVAILVAVGWFIVKALFDRRRDADEWTEMELPRPTRPAAPVPPQPIQRTSSRPPAPPKPPANYRPPKPPPITARPPTIRPILVKEEEGPTRGELARLNQSQESYSRAEHLHESVANRLSAIDKQTASAKPTQPGKRTTSAAAAHVVRTFRNPTTVRQAFLAQFVLNPPKSLE
ncbi:MAG TPA: hypothetical protein VM680_05005 [Verrucomicrobiae bacterium]|nr:hypothetical protein [Verrucomicrobiae bacterium]